MAGMMDFLQSASNEAAGTVAAPVDIIAWLMRKAGVPVQQPVGGKSDVWQQVLTDASKKLNDAEMRVTRILERNGQALP